MDFTDTARAPMQAGDITTTALAALALSRYGPSAEATSTQERLSRARDLLLGAEPQTTDDLAFRLLGLKWTAAAAEQQAAADRLRAAQRSGGGWAQQANMPPDAYATGLSLFALHEGGMAVSEPAWRF